MSNFIVIRSFPVNSNSVSIIARKAMMECGASDQQIAMFWSGFNSTLSSNGSGVDFVFTAIRGFEEKLAYYLEYASLDKSELEVMRKTLSFFATDYHPQIKDEVRFIDSIIPYAVEIDNLDLDELKKRREYVKGRINSYSEFKHQFESEFVRLDKLIEQAKETKELTIAELEAAMPGFVCISIDKNGNRNMHRLEGDEIVVGHRSDGTSVVKGNRVVMGHHYKLIRMLAENYGNLYRDFRVDEDDYTDTMTAIVSAIRTARHSLAKALTHLPNSPSVENANFKIKKLEESITSDGSIEDTVYWWLETFGISSIIK